MTNFEYIQTPGKDAVIRVVTPDTDRYTAWLYAVDAAIEYLHTVEDGRPRWVAISTGSGKYIPPDTYLSASVSPQQIEADQRQCNTEPGTFPEVSIIEGNG